MTTSSKDSDSSTATRVAVAQTAPELGATERNLRTIVDWLGEAASQGAKLVVFPECALSGYVAEEAGELQGLAESVPGPATQRIATACERWQTHCVVGLIEHEGAAYYNSAVLVGPQGLIGCYRKAHLPGLGADRLVCHGNTPFSVYETAVGRVGIAICYDMRFPEVARVLALKGADIIAAPTNWPSFEEVAPPSTIPDILTRARACENRVFMAVADRVGTERGWTFIGRSQLIDVFGGVVAEADATSETILYADCDLAQARQKDFVYKAGCFETHWFADRRTDLYGPLVDPELWVQSERRRKTLP